MEVLKAAIFDIQRFSVHDGPGIRTLVFFKGCPLECIWCSNPESQSLNRERAYIKGRCIYCCKCVTACTNKAPVVKSKKIIFKKNLCNLCEKCVEACSANAIIIYGNEINSNDLMKEIRKDSVFFKNSGGGVTFGGGEPLIWSKFIKELSIKCKAENIKTAIETCGFVPWENILDVLNYTDLFLYDLKHINPEIHKKLCGKSNKLIMKNLMKLSSQDKINIIIRIPVIPGHNDSDNNIKETSKFIKSINAKNNIKRIDLLPYFKYHLKKYENLGKKYCLNDIKESSKKKLLHMKKLIENNGLIVQIGV